MMKKLKKMAVDVDVVVEAQPDWQMKKKKVQMLFDEVVKARIMMKA